MLARTDARSRRRRISMLWGVWAVTRGVSAAVILEFVSWRLLQGSAGDVGLYRRWGRLIAEGAFPSGDPRWQYPPLAGVVMWLPRLSGADYLTTFVVLMVLVDALIVVLLLRAGGPAAGAWAWVAGMFLLGPFCYARYDLVAALVAVAALLALPRMRTFGALAAVGAMLKVWPLLLLLALPRGRGGARAAAAFAVAAGVCLPVAAALGPGGWGFLAGQQDRGLQTESVAATPFHVARVLGWTGVITRHRYGSSELVGTGVQATAAGCLLLTVALLAAVAVIARRRPAADWNPALACDVALAAVLAAVVTSRVLSPQYLVWLLATGAVCLTHGATRQRSAVALILAAALVAHVEFPLLWRSIARGHATGVGVLLARNLLCWWPPPRWRSPGCGPAPPTSRDGRIPPAGKIATLPER